MDCGYQVPIQWRRQRHDGGAPDVDKLLGHDGIVIGIGQHDESFFDENFRRFDQSSRIGEQRSLVTEHFKFNQIRHAGGPGQTSIAQCIFYVVTAGGVGKNGVLLRVEIIEEVLLGAIVILTRRTATVTTSAPDASMAFWFQQNPCTSRSQRTAGT
jgi:hypothetical protein